MKYLITLAVLALAACAGEPVSTPVQTVVDGSGHPVLSAGGVVRGGDDSTFGAPGSASDSAE